MQATLETVATMADDLPVKPNQDLDHLPGPPGHWLTGNARNLLPNLGPFVREQQAVHGNCFTVGLFRNTRVVMMVGPQANEMILLDKDNNFSSRLGWEVLLELFGRNVLVRDFADHKQHRRLMTHVFKPGTLSGYLNQMNPIIAGSLSDYEGVVDVYARTKQMALEIAVEVFAGIQSGPEIEVWNRDLNLVLSNAMAHKIRLPGTRYSRCLRARDRLRKRLSNELCNRRKAGGGDLFSQLATQQNENGEMLSDSDVIDHMFGMLFAAHDTTASSLAMIFWLLAHHNEWQEKLRVECELLHARGGSNQLTYDSLDQLSQVDWVFKEALRLYSPLQLIPRRSVHAFEFEGLKIPENTALYLVPQAVHFDPKYYSNPDQFDPSRFAASNTENRNNDPFAFIPFGRGSHMCLGMHFAYMEIKAVVYQTLLSRRLEPASPEALELEYLPIVRPTTSMAIRFSTL
ncbi:MAG: cytochrome P450 [Pseudomonadales bacterium]|nr:cytochrome P450 [Pseudomonadales bacterium]